MAIKKVNFKKILKYTGLSILGLFVVLNLGIILSGKFYIYKAVISTYFRGQTGPGIYDLDVFYNRKVEKGNSKSLTTSKSLIEVSEVQEEYFVEMESTSFLVIKGDTIIAEKYWEDHDKNVISNSFSAAKSIVSLLIGILQDQGKLNINDKVGKYLISFQNNGKDDISIKDILTMSSGLEWDESGGNPFSHNAEAYYGWALNELIDNLSVEEESGKHFIYKSGNTQVLAMIINEITGSTVSEFASKVIWSQIETENDAYWSLDDENGVEKAFCCFYATTRDFARIGMLINNKGRWGNKQIVSESYISEMVKPASYLTDEYGRENTVYGYQWWIYNGLDFPVYYARGILGQYIISVPSKDLVIVRTGHDRYESLSPEMLESDEFSDFSEYEINHPVDMVFYLKTGLEMFKDS